MSALARTAGHSVAMVPVQRRRIALSFAVLLLLLTFCFRAQVRGDGVGYYAYLPSVIGQRSLDVQSTFQDFLHAGLPVYAANLQIRLPNGMTADYKQVGSALLALPFYAVATFVLGVTPKTEDPALDPVYQFAFTAAALAYALLALFLLYQFTRNLWGPWSARLAVVGAVFGTPLVAYLLFEPSYNHAFTVAAITLFALFLYRTGPGRKAWQWFVLGLLGGVMAITHVQEALFLGLIPAEAVWAMSQRKWRARAIIGYLIAFAGIAIAVTPQILFDRVMFEGWLPPSAPNISFDFLHPHLLELLTSTHHGWLSWSPLVVVALFGLPLLVRRLGWFALALIVIGLGEIWINAAISDWWGGLGFGSRRLTDQTLLLTLSFAALFDWARARVPKLVIGTVTAGVAWTVVLLAQYYYIIRVDAGPTWGDFLLGQLRAIPYVPRLFVQGTAIRDLATGHLLSALVATAALALLLGGVLLQGRRLPVPRQT